MDTDMREATDVFGEWAETGKDKGMAEGHRVSVDEMIKFSLDETGKVDSAEIHEEYPVGVFSDSAIRSVRQTIYKPTIKDGIFQRTDNVLTKVSFKMAPSKKAHENIDCSSSKPDYSTNNLCRQVE